MWKHLPRKYKLVAPDMYCVEKFKILFEAFLKLLKGLSHLFYCIGEGFNQHYLAVHFIEDHMTLSFQTSGLYTHYKITLRVFLKTVILLTFDRKKLFLMRFYENTKTFFLVNNMEHLNRNGFAYRGFFLETQTLQPHTLTNMCPTPLY